MLEFQIDSTRIHNRMYKLEFNHNNKLLNIISLLNNSSSNNIKLKFNQFSKLINLLQCKQILLMHNQPQSKPLFTLNKLPSTLNNLQFKPLFMPNLLQSKMRQFMLSQPPSTPNLLLSMLNLCLFNIMSPNLNMHNQNLLSKLIKVLDHHMQMITSELGIQELF